MDMKRKSEDDLEKPWKRQAYKDCIAEGSSTHQNDAFENDEAVAVAWEGISYAAHVVLPASKAKHFHIWYDDAEEFETNVTQARIQKLKGGSGKNKGKSNGARSNAARVAPSTTDKYKKVYSSTTRRSYR